MDGLTETGQCRLQSLLQCRMRDLVLFPILRSLHIVRDALLARAIHSITDLVQTDPLF